MMRKLILSATMLTGMIMGVGSVHAAPVPVQPAISGSRTVLVDYYWNHHHWHHRSWDRHYHRWHYYN